MADGDTDRSEELAALPASEIETAAQLISALLRTPTEDLEAFRGQLVGKSAEVDLARLRLAREHLKAVYVAIKLDDEAWWEDMRAALQVLTGSEGAPAQPALPFADTPHDAPLPHVPPPKRVGMGTLSQSAFLGGGPPPALPFEGEAPPLTADAGSPEAVEPSPPPPAPVEESKPDTEPPGPPSADAVLPFVSVPAAPPVPSAVPSAVPSPPADAAADHDEEAKESAD